MTIMVARTAVSVLVLATHALGAALQSLPVSSRPLKLVGSAGPAAGQLIPQASVLPQPAPSDLPRSVSGPERYPISLGGPQRRRCFLSCSDLMAQSPQNPGDIPVSEVPQSLVRNKKENSCTLTISRAAASTRCCNWGDAARPQHPRKYPPTLHEQ